MMSAINMLNHFFFGIHLYGTIFLLVILLNLFLIKYNHKYHCVFTVTAFLYCIVTVICCLFFIYLIAMRHKRPGANVKMLGVAVRISIHFWSAKLSCARVLVR